MDLYICHLRRREMSVLAQAIVIMVVSILVALGIFFFFYQLFEKKIKLRNATIEKLIQNMKEINLLLNYYPDLNETLNNNEIVSALWNKYKRNFVIIPDEDGVNHVYSTADSDEYFNFTNLSIDLSVEFWQNLAGVFTGLGILGTFLGLTIGLLGFDMSSSATIQKGISKLLNGTSAAFITSIVGILSALGFNWWYNTCLIKKFSTNINEFTDQLDELIPRKQAEELLYINSEAVKEQTEQLQEFNTTIALSIGDAMRTAMTTDVKPVLEELVKAIRDLSQGGMETIRNSINDNTGEELRNFAGTLQELQQGMRDILTQSQKINGENNQRLQSAVERMVNSLQVATADSITTQQNNMNEMNGKIQRSFNDITNRLNATVEKLNDSLNKASQNLLDAGSQTGTQLHNSIQDAAETSDTIMKRWETISEQQQKQLANNIEKICRILEETLQNIKKDRENYIQTLQTIGHTIQETMNSSDKLIKQAGETADQFATTADPIKDVALTMNTGMTNVLDATKSFNTQVGMTVLELKNTSSKNVESINTIKGALETTEKSWRIYEEVFKGLDNQISLTLKELEENLVKYNQLTQDGLANNLEEFDIKIRGVLGQINTLIEELNETAEDLKEVQINNLKNKTSYRGR